MTFGAHIPELQLTEQQVDLALRAAKLSTGETYLELGSGEGIGLVAAARDFGAIACGVEILPHAIDATHALAEEAGVTVVVEQGDLVGYDTGHADVLLMHLGPAFHDVLARKLECELRPGATVAACGWRVPGWKPFDLPDRFDDYEGYIYRPADPFQHASFVNPLQEIEGEPGTAWVAELVLTSHTDLVDVEVACEQSTGDAVRFSAEPGRTRLARGQGTSVLISGVLPDEGVETAVDVQILARHEFREPDDHGPRMDPHRLRLIGRAATPEPFD